jgi:tRNA(fMet)-specific endonuclease VapC
VTEPRALFDANCCIYMIEQLSPALRQRAERCAPGEIVTSAIVFAEVARGTDWSNEEAAGLVNEFFEAVAVLPFDRPAALFYGELPFIRHRFDRLIAAHALALDLTLVTGDARDFRDIPNLRVEDWTL